MSGTIEFYSGIEFNDTARTLPNENRVRLTKMEAFELLLEGKPVYLRTPSGYEEPFILREV